MKCKFLTIVVLDVHLGTGGSTAKEVTDRLKCYRCRKLILTGEIIDRRMHHPAVWQPDLHELWELG